YYAVSGASSWQIREQIDRKRPWKQPGDGLTTWKIDWSFTTLRGDSGCRLQSLEIKTQVTITLPQWTPPGDADEALKERWKSYIKALGAHEDGHRKLAVAAAAELRKR